VLLDLPQVAAFLRKTFPGERNRSSPLQSGIDQPLSPTAPIQTGRVVSVSAPPPTSDSSLPINNSVNGKSGRVSACHFLNFKFQTCIIYADCRPSCHPVLIYKYQVLCENG